MEYRISIDRCPHGNIAVSLANQTHGTGTRLTPNRCCKQWVRETSWRLSERELRNIGEEFLAAARVLRLLTANPSTSSHLYHDPAEDDYGNQS